MTNCKCEHKTGIILWENENYEIVKCEYGCGKISAYPKLDNGLIGKPIETTKKPYITDRPEFGDAYYWFHDGLWRSTPPISKMMELQNANQ